jgi:hypothetical protein
VTTPDETRQLLELLDRANIIETTFEMARCLDQLDYAALEECLLDEVAVRYEHVVEDEMVTMPAAEFVAAWREAMSGLETTQHLLSNHRVDVDGDEATCTAYCVIQHYYPEPSGSCLWTVGGHYDFEFVRTAEGWRIAVLEMAGFWAQGNRHLLQRAAGSPGEGPGDRGVAPRQERN